VQGIYYRLNGMERGQPFVIPYQGMKMVVDGLQAAWKERDELKAELEALKNKPKLGRPPKDKE
jgi:hypothetical protein